jgi:DNA mismatch repair protein MutH
MNIISRIVAFDALSKYIGFELSDFAKEFNITIKSGNGKINKGWKGLVIERLAGLTNDNKSSPNGIGFELKTVPYVFKNGMWKPKETMAITMINYDNLINEDFYNSHLWNKLKSMIYCYVSYDKSHSITSKLLNIDIFDYQGTDEVFNLLKEDYDFIRNKYIQYGKDSLTAKDGKYIQARTKGSGHGSTSRAFYAKKLFLEKFCLKEKISKVA